MERNIRLGSRGSQLALWQANWVKSELEKRHKNLVIEIIKIKTTGDKILDVPLAKVGGKGLFVKEIEEALLKKRIDMAVHSMKDVPTDFPSGLHLAAITEREDPRDALIISQKSKAKIQKFKDLAYGATIGTSSLRRSSQLLNLRPDLKILQLRGNLNTRLKKLDDGGFDAIILAAAGVKRLGWSERITEYLSPEVSLPAIGQGALGIETRMDDKEINEMAAFFDHPATSISVRAERAFLKKLEGGCQVPIAAYGEIKNNQLKLIGLVASIDGKKIIKDSITGQIDRTEAVGIELAEKLLSMGAWDILKEVYKTAPPMQGGAG